MRVRVCVCVYTCTYQNVSLVWSESSASMHMFYMCVSWVCVYVCLHVHISMYHLCGGIDSWVDVRVRICFTCVFRMCVHIYMYRLCGGIDTWVEHGAGACVCVYVCIHVHIKMYRLCGWSQVRVCICFTCVFHGCLRMDSGIFACVCVYVCIHVHIYVYRWCGRSQKGKCAYVLHVCFIGA